MSDCGALRDDALAMRSGDRRTVWILYAIEFDQATLVGLR